MRTESSETIADTPDATLPDLDEFAGYEDGESYVVCDRENATAWIRSDVTTTLSP